MRTIDRPLTDAQERALITLAELADSAPKSPKRCEHGWLTHNGDNPSSYGGAGIVTTEHEVEGWFPVWKIARSAITAHVLERLGLVELRIEEREILRDSVLEVRITDEGRAMLASMGD